MERNDREDVNANTGGEQTSFGSQLNDSDRGVGSRVKRVASSVSRLADGFWKDCTSFRAMAIPRCASPAMASGQSPG